MAISESRVIAVVDDDESVREALKSLLRSVGFNAETFASAEDFLKANCLQATACLLLDIRLPGISGLELQRQPIAAHCRVTHSGTRWEIAGNTANRPGNEQSLDHTGYRRPDAATDGLWRPGGSHRAPGIVVT